MKIISNSALRAFALEHQADAPLKGCRRVIGKTGLKTEVSSRKLSALWAELESF